MTCPSKAKSCVRSQHLVSQVVEELGAEQITVELVPPEQEAKWNKLVRRHHYLKQDRMVGESLRYVAKRGEEWIALLGWSSAAYHLSPRDKWIQWSTLQRQARRHWVVCNARFVLLNPKLKIPNLASQILSLNLQRLCQDWQEHYLHPVVLAETYVDPERFEGTCYRAANWIEIGLTKGFGRSRLDFYQLHQHPKAIFLYPLRRNATQLLSAPVLPKNWTPYQRLPQAHHYPLSHAQNMSPVQMQGFRRGHWGIEARHYVRDVSFGEDRSNACKGHTPQNMATLRNLIIGMCAIDTAKKQQRSSCLSAFRTAANNNRDLCTRLVSRPLLEGA